MSWNNSFPASIRAHGDRVELRDPSPESERGITILPEINPFAERERERLEREAWRASTVRYDSSTAGETYSQDSGSRRKKVSRRATQPNPEPNFDDGLPPPVSRLGKQSKAVRQETPEPVYSEDVGEPPIKPKAKKKTKPASTSVVSPPDEPAPRKVVKGSKQPQPQDDAPATKPAYKMVQNDDDDGLDGLSDEEPTVRSPPVVKAAAKMVVTPNASSKTSKRVRAPVPKEEPIEEPKEPTKDGVKDQTEDPKDPDNKPVRESDHAETTQPANEQLAQPPNPSANPLPNVPYSWAPPPWYWALPFTQPPGASTHPVLPYYPVQPITAHDLCPTCAERAVKRPPVCGGCHKEFAESGSGPSTSKPDPESETKSVPVLTESHIREVVKSELGKIFKDDQVLKALAGSLVDALKAMAVEPTETPAAAETSAADSTFLARLDAGTLKVGEELAQEDKPSAPVNGTPVDGPRPDFQDDPGLDTGPRTITGEADDRKGEPAALPEVDPAPTTVFETVAADKPLEIEPVGVAIATEEDATVPRFDAPTLSKEPVVDETVVSVVNGEKQVTVPESTSTPGLESGVPVVETSPTQRPITNQDVAPVVGGVLDDKKLSVLTEPSTDTAPVPSADDSRDNVETKAIPCNTDPATPHEPVTAGVSTSTERVDSHATDSPSVQPPSVNQSQSPNPTLVESTENPAQPPSLSSVPGPESVTSPIENNATPAASTDEVVLNLAPVENPVPVVEPATEISEPKFTEPSLEFAATPSASEAIRGVDEDFAEVAQNPVPEPVVEPVPVDTPAPVEAPAQPVVDHEAPEPAQAPLGDVKPGTDEILAIAAPPDPTDSSSSSNPTTAVVAEETPTSKELPTIEKLEDESISRPATEDSQSVPQLKVELPHTTISPTAPTAEPSTLVAEAASGNVEPEQPSPAFDAAHLEPVAPLAESELVLGDESKAEAVPPVGPVSAPKADPTSQLTSTSDPAQSPESEPVHSSAAPLHKNEKLSEQNNTSGDVPNILAENKPFVEPEPTTNVTTTTTTPETIADTTSSVAPVEDPLAKIPDSSVLSNKDKADPTGGKEPTSVDHPEFREDEDLKPESEEKPSQEPVLPSTQHTNNSGEVPDEASNSSSVAVNPEQKVDEPAIQDTISPLEPAATALSDAHAEAPVAPIPDTSSEHPPSESLQVSQPILPDAAGHVEASKDPEHLQQTSPRVPVSESIITPGQETATIEPGVAGSPAIGKPDAAPGSESSSSSADNLAPLPPPTISPIQDTEPSPAVLTVTPESTGPMTENTPAIRVPSEPTEPSVTSDQPPIVETAPTESSPFRVEPLTDTVAPLSTPETEAAPTCDNEPTAIPAPGSPTTPPATVDSSSNDSSTPEVMHAVPSIPTCPPRPVAAFELVTKPEYDETAISTVPATSDATCPADSASDPAPVVPTEETLSVEKSESEAAPVVSSTAVCPSPSASPLGQGDVPASDPAPEVEEPALAPSDRHGGEEGVGEPKVDEPTVGADGVISEVGEESSNTGAPSEKRIATLGEVESPVLEETAIAVDDKNTGVVEEPGKLSPTPITDSTLEPALAAKDSPNPVIESKPASSVDPQPEPLTSTLPDVVGAPVPGETPAPIPTLETGSEPKLEPAEDTPTVTVDPPAQTPESKPIEDEQERTVPLEETAPIVGTDKPGLEVPADQKEVGEEIVEQSTTTPSPVLGESTQDDTKSTQVVASEPVDSSTPVPQIELSMSTESTLKPQPAPVPQDMTPNTGFAAETPSISDTAAPEPEAPFEKLPAESATTSDATAIEQDLLPAPRTEVLPEQVPLPQDPNPDTFFEEPVAQGPAVCPVNEPVSTFGPEAQPESQSTPEPCSNPGLAGDTASQPTQALPRPLEVPNSPSTSTLEPVSKSGNENLLEHDAAGSDGATGDVAAVEPSLSVNAPVEPKLEEQVPHVPDVGSRNTALAAEGAQTVEAIDDQETCKLPENPIVEEHEQPAVTDGTLSSPTLPAQNQADKEESKVPVSDVTPDPALESTIAGGPATSIVSPTDAEPKPEQPESHDSKPEDSGITLNHEEVKGTLESQAPKAGADVEVCAVPEEIVEPEAPGKGQESEVQPSAVEEYPNAVKESTEPVVHQSDAAGAAAPIACEGNEQPTPDTDPSFVESTCGPILSPILPDPPHSTSTSTPTTEAAPITNPSADLDQTSPAPPIVDQTANATTAPDRAHTPVDGTESPLGGSSAQLSAKEPVTEPTPAIASLIPPAVESAVEPSQPHETITPSPAPDTSVTEPDSVTVTNNLDSSPRPEQIDNSAEEEAVVSKPETGSKTEETPDQPEQAHLESGREEAASADGQTTEAHDLAKESAQPEFIPASDNDLPAPTTSNDNTSSSAAPPVETTTLEPVPTTTSTPSTKVVPAEPPVLASTPGNTLDEDNAPAAQSFVEPTQPPETPSVTTSALEPISEATRTAEEEAPRNSEQHLAGPEQVNPGLPVGDTEDSKAEEKVEPTVEHAESEEQNLAANESDDKTIEKGEHVKEPAEVATSDIAQPQDDAQVLVANTGSSTHKEGGTAHVPVIQAPEVATVAVPTHEEPSQTPTEPVEDLAVEPVVVPIAISEPASVFGESSSSPPVISSDSVETRIPVPSELEHDTAAPTSPSESEPQLVIPEQIGLNEPTAPVPEVPETSVGKPNSESDSTPSSTPIAAQDSALALVTTPVVSEATATVVSGSAGSSNDIGPALSDLPNVIYPAAPIEAGPAPSVSLAGEPESYPDVPVLLPPSPTPEPIAITADQQETDITDEPEVAGEEKVGTSIAGKPEERKVDVIGVGCDEEKADGGAEPVVDSRVPGNQPEDVACDSAVKNKSENTAEHAPVVESTTSPTLPSQPEPVVPSNPLDTNLEISTDLVPAAPPSSSAADAEPRHVTWKEPVAAFVNDSPDVASTEKIEILTNNADVEAPAITQDAAVDPPTVEPALEPALGQSVGPELNITQTPNSNSTSTVDPPSHEATVPTETDANSPQACQTSPEPGADSSSTPNPDTFDPPPTTPQPNPDAGLESAKASSPEPVVLPNLSSQPMVVLAAPQPVTGPSSVDANTTLSPPFKSEVALEPAAPSTTHPACSTDCPPEPESCTPAPAPVLESTTSTLAGSVSSCEPVCDSTLASFPNPSHTDPVGDTALPLVHPVEAVKEDPIAAIPEAATDESQGVFKPAKEGTRLGDTETNSSVLASTVGNTPEVQANDQLALSDDGPSTQQEPLDQSVNVNESTEPPSGIPSLLESQAGDLAAATLNQNVHAEEETEATDKETSCAPQATSEDKDVDAIDTCATGPTTNEVGGVNPESGMDRQESETTFDEPDKRDAPNPVLNPVPPDMPHAEPGTIPAEDPSLVANSTIGVEQSPVPPRATPEPIAPGPVSKPDLASNTSAPPPVISVPDFPDAIPESIPPPVRVEDATSAPASSSTPLDNTMPSTIQSSDSTNPTPAPECAPVDPTPESDLIATPETHSEVEASTEPAPVVESTPGQTPKSSSTVDDSLVFDLTAKEPETQPETTSDSHQPSAPVSTPKLATISSQALETDSEEQKKEPVLANEPMIANPVSSLEQRDGAVPAHDQLHPDVGTTVVESKGDKSELSTETQTTVPIPSCETLKTEVADPENEVPADVPCVTLPPIETSAEKLDNKKDDVSHILPTPVPTPIEPGATPTLMPPQNEPAVVATPASPTELIPALSVPSSFPATSILPLTPASPLAPVPCADPADSSKANSTPAATEPESIPLPDDDEGSSEALEVISAPIQGTESTSPSCERVTTEAATDPQLEFMVGCDEQTPACADPPSEPPSGSPLARVSTPPPAEPVSQSKLPQSTAPSSVPTSIPGPEIVEQSRVETPISKEGQGIEKDLENESSPDTGNSIPGIEETLEKPVETDQERIANETCDNLPYSREEMASAEPAPVCGSANPDGNSGNQSGEPEVVLPAHQVEMEKNEACGAQEPAPDSTSVAPPEHVPDVPATSRSDLNPNQVADSDRPAPDSARTAIDDAPPASESKTDTAQLALSSAPDPAPSPDPAAKDASPDSHEPILPSLTVEMDNEGPESSIEHELLGETKDAKTEELIPQVKEPASAQTTVDEPEDNTIPTEEKAIQETVVSTDLAHDRQAPEVPAIGLSADAAPVAVSMVEQPGAVKGGHSPVALRQSTDTIDTTPATTPAPPVESTPVIAPVPESSSGTLPSSAAEPKSEEASSPAQPTSKPGSKQLTLLRWFSRKPTPKAKDNGQSSVNAPTGDSAIENDPNITKEPVAILTPTADPQAVPNPNLTPSGVVDISSPSDQVQVPVVDSSPTPPSDDVTSRTTSAPDPCSAGLPASIAEGTQLDSDKSVQGEPYPQESATDVNNPHPGEASLSVDPSLPIEPKAVSEPVSAHTPTPGADSQPEPLLDQAHDGNAGKNATPESEPEPTASPVAEGLQLQETPIGEAVPDETESTTPENITKLEDNPVPDSKADEIEIMDEAPVVSNDQADDVPVAETPAPAAQDPVGSPQNSDSIPAATVEETSQVVQDNLAPDTAPGQVINAPNAPNTNPAIATAPEPASSVETVSAGAPVAESTPTPTGTVSSSAPISSTPDESPAPTIPVTPPPDSGSKNWTWHRLFGRKPTPKSTPQPAPAPQASPKAPTHETETDGHREQTDLSKKLGEPEPVTNTDTVTTTKQPEGETSNAIPELRPLQDELDRRTVRADDSVVVPEPMHTLAPLEPAPVSTPPTDPVSVSEVSAVEQASDAPSIALPTEQPESDYVSTPTSKPDTDLTEQRSGDLYDSSEAPTMEHKHLDEFDASLGLNKSIPSTIKTPLAVTEDEAKDGGEDIGQIKNNVEEAKSNDETIGCAPVPAVEDLKDGTQVETKIDDHLQVEEHTTGEPASGFHTTAEYDETPDSSEAAPMPKSAPILAPEAATTTVQTPGHEGTPSPAPNRASTPTPTPEANTGRSPIPASDPAPSVAFELSPASTPAPPQHVVLVEEVPSSPTLNSAPSFDNPASAPANSLKADEIASDPSPASRQASESNAELGFQPVSDIEPDSASIPDPAPHESERAVVANPTVLVEETKPPKSVELEVEAETKNYPGQAVGIQPGKDIRDDDENRDDAPTIVTACSDTKVETSDNRTSVPDTICAGTMTGAEFKASTLSECLEKPSSSTAVFDKDGGPVDPDQASTTGPEITREATPVLAVAPISAPALTDLPDPVPISEAASDPPTPDFIPAALSPDLLFQLALEKILGLSSVHASSSGSALGLDLPTYPTPFSAPLRSMPNSYPDARSEVEPVASVPVKAPTPAHIPQPVLAPTERNPASTQVPPDQGNGRIDKEVTETVAGPVLDAPQGSRVPLPTYGAESETPGDNSIEGHSVGSSVVLSREEPEVIHTSRETEERFDLDTIGGWGWPSTPSYAPMFSPPPFGGPGYPASSFFHSTPIPYTPPASARGPRPSSESSASVMTMPVPMVPTTVDSPPAHIRSNRSPVPRPLSLVGTHPPRPSSQPPTPTSGTIPMSARPFGVGSRYRPKRVAHRAQGSAPGPLVTPESSRVFAPGTPLASPPATVDAPAPVVVPTPAPTVTSVPIAAPIPVVASSPVKHSTPKSPVTPRRVPSPSPMVHRSLSKALTRGFAPPPAMLSTPSLTAMVVNEVPHQLSPADHATRALDEAISAIDDVMATIGNIPGFRVSDTDKSSVRAPNRALERPSIPVQCEPVRAPSPVLTAAPIQVPTATEAERSEPILVPMPATPPPQRSTPSATLSPNLDPSSVSELSLAMSTELIMSPPSSRTKTPTPSLHGPTSPISPSRSGSVRNRQSARRPESSRISSSSFRRRYAGHVVKDIDY
ncbi:hypothetical protein RhiJN_22531 [Ceratobasidium sp. AG-Ba]|nr:hypothetical protein RhiJN_22531 [Ceratobasidium sp. AG-Ba]